MRKLSGFLITALLVAPCAFAGVVYDFSTVTKSQGETSTMSGVAFVEGSDMRMDLTEGDGQMFESGSALISRDGGSTIVVLDEGDKTYWELNVADVFNQLGAMMESMGSNLDLSVKPRKVSVTDIGAGGDVEGYSTRKYDVSSDYVIEIGMMGMSMKMDVQSQTTLWATPELSSEYATFFQSKGFRTGLPALDEMLDEYADKMKGFPLRSESTTNMKMMGRDIKSTSVMSVSNVREENVSDNRFDVPSGYREIESPMKSMMKGMKR